jgi:hypothetical protein
VVVVVVVVVGGRVTVGNVGGSGGGGVGGCVSGGGAVVSPVGASAGPAVGAVVRRARGFLVVVVAPDFVVRDAFDERVDVPLELRRCPDTLGAEPAGCRALPVDDELDAPACADATGRGVWP